MRDNRSRLAIRSLKEANYHTIDCHSLSFSDFNNGLLDEFTGDHTSREIADLERDFFIEVKKVETVRDAVRLYSEILDSLLEEIDMEFREKNGKMVMRVFKCDFRSACPRSPGCLCLRGRYIRDAIERIGPVSSGEVEFRKSSEGSCYLKMMLDVDDEAAEKGEVLNEDYLKDIKESIERSSGKDRDQFHIEHFSKGTVSTAQDVLPKGQLGAFLQMFSIQLKEAHTRMDKKRKIMSATEDDSSKKKEAPSGLDGRIISCPRCGAFINLNKGRSCGKCGKRLE